METPEITKRYQEEVLDYVNGRRQPPGGPNTQKPIEALAAKATTAIILAHNNLYQPLSVDNIVLDGGSSTILKENNVYRIFDGEKDHVSILALVHKISSFIRLCNDSQGKSGNSGLLTSYLMMKVKSCPYPIPVSRGSAQLSYKNSNGDTNPGLYFVIYPQRITGDTIFRPELDDIEYIDMVVLTSVRSFKKYLKYAKNIKKVLDDSHISEEFDESLV
jgi:hypothetical protein